MRVPGGAVAVEDQPWQGREHEEHRPAHPRPWLSSWCSFVQIQVGVRGPGSPGDTAHGVHVQEREQDREQIQDK